MPVRTSSHILPRVRSFGVPASVALLGLSACNTDPKNSGRSPYDHSPGLSRFASCDDMRDYMVDAWTESLVQARYGDGGGGAPQHGAMEGGGEADMASDGGGGAPRDYSQTNVQEAGVDEPDIVKTDGEHIYVVHFDQLTILDSWPAEDTAVVGSVSLPGYPMSMFIDGDHALIYSYDWEYSGFYEGYGYGDTMLLTIVDVSDRSQPEVVREVRLEGGMADARMLDGDVYTVIRSWVQMPDRLWELAWDRYPGLPQYSWRWSESRVRELRQRAREEFRPKVKRVLDGIPTEELLPAFSDSLPGEDAPAQTLLGCTDLYRPNHLSSPNILSVVHLDLGSDTLEDGADVSATGLMADGWEVYASEDHLVVSQASWSWWWNDRDPEVTTHLHQFALGGEDTVYEASGAVPGWLLNNYSLSEYDEHLRVATSDAGWWDSDDEPANNVFVLKNRSGKLDVVGAVRGIAPNETIQSARFMGKKGYLVTYEQIDPLFTLDLSDPTDPRVVGELKLPGFSTYLHPVDDNHLLGVGYDGTWEGELTGMAIHLFDLTDFADPKVQSSITLSSDDWSWSEALWDFHAFTLHRGVLSLPLYTYSYDSSTGNWEDFSGMLVVDVDTEAGLTELGRVNHADLVAESRCVYDWDRGAPCADDWWYAQMRRSVVIEDNLFSISDYGVKVTDLTDPTTVHARVLFWPL